MGFDKWLKDNTNLSESSINSYVNVLKNISHEMMYISVIDKPLYKMNLDELKDAITLIFNNDKFTQKDNRCNKIYSNAIKHYYRFLSCNNRQVNVYENMNSDKMQNFNNVRHNIQNNNVELQELYLAMALKYLQDYNISFRKLEMNYLHINSPVRGGGFQAKKIVNNLGVTAEMKGILNSLSLQDLISKAHGRLYSTLLLIDKQFAKIQNIIKLSDNSASNNIIVDNISNKQINSYQEKIEKNNNLQVKKDIIKHNNINLNDIVSELNALIGLDDIKKEINSLVAVLNMDCIKENSGMPLQKIENSLYDKYIFMGNRGTGKKTIASIIGKIYFYFGILNKEHIIKICIDDFMGDNLSYLSEKINELVKTAIDGVLYIDVNYNFTNNVDKEKWLNIFNTIIQECKLHKNEFICIISGYKHLIDELIKYFPNDFEKINKIFCFNDFKPEQMLDLFKIICTQSGYSLTDDASTTLKAYFQTIYNNKDNYFNNAVTINEIFQTVKRMQSIRLTKLAQNRNISIDKEELSTFSEQDIIESIDDKFFKLDVEYEKQKMKYSKYAIYDALKESNIERAIVSVCNRLESLLECVYKFQGDLFTKINELKEAKNKLNIEISNLDFSKINNIRKCRNKIVHPSGNKDYVSDSEVLDVLNIIEKLEISIM